MKRSKAGAARRTVLAVRLPEELARQVKAYAAIRGLKVQEFVEGLLRRAIAPTDQ